MIGRSALASRLTRPDFSARRIMPSHKAIIPASGSAKVMTAVLQASKTASVTSPSWPDTAPSRTASTKSKPDPVEHGGQFVSRKRELQSNFVPTICATRYIAIGPRRFGASFSTTQSAESENNPWSQKASAYFIRSNVSWRSSY